MSLGGQMGIRKWVYSMVVVLLVDTICQDIMDTRSARR